MVIKLNNFSIGDNKKLTILAGPCAIESESIIDETADALKSICQKLDINYVFKSSFDKANRSSINSYRGPGMEKGLEMLSVIKEKFKLPIVTDIHTPEQAEPVAKFVICTVDDRTKAPLRKGPSSPPCTGGCLRSRRGVVSILLFYR